MLDKFEVSRPGGGEVYLRLTDSLEWALHRALRYDFGRHTATAGDVAVALIELVPDLSDKTLICMARDIKGWLEKRDRIIEVNGGKPLGIEIYEHDARPNIDLKSVIEQELTKRGKLDEYHTVGVSFSRG